LVTVRFLAVFSSGFVAGILFGDRMGVSFARPKLPASSFVTFQQIQNLRFARMMPFPMGISVLASVAWVVLDLSRAKTTGFLFLALGTAAAVSVVVLTRAVNIPINDRLGGWDPAAPQPDLAQIWARWEKAHTVRTVMAVLAFALELLAFGMSGNGVAT
jgi:uncharacterized membrane protein